MSSRGCERSLTGFSTSADGACGLFSYLLQYCQGLRRWPPSILRHRRCALRLGTQSCYSLCWSSEDPYLCPYQYRQLGRKQWLRWVNCHCVAEGARAWHGPQQHPHKESLPGGTAGSFPHCSAKCDQHFPHSALGSTGCCLGACMGGGTPSVWWHVLRDQGGLWEGPKGDCPRLLQTHRLR